MDLTVYPYDTSAATSLELDCSCHLKPDVVSTNVRDYATWVAASEDATVYHPCTVVWSPKVQTIVVTGGSNKQALTQEAISCRL